MYMVSGLTTLYWTVNKRAHCWERLISLLPAVMLFACSYLSRGETSWKFPLSTLQCPLTLPLFQSCLYKWFSGHWWPHLVRKVAQILTLLFAALYISIKAIRCLLSHISSNYFPDSLFHSLSHSPISLFFSDPSVLQLSVKVYLFPTWSSSASVPLTWWLDFVHWFLKYYLYGD